MAAGLKPGMITGRYDLKQMSIPLKIPPRLCRKNKVLLLSRVFGQRGCSRLTKVCQQISVSSTPRRISITKSFSINSCTH